MPTTFRDVEKVLSDAKAQHRHVLLDFIAARVHVREQPDDTSWAKRASVWKQ